MQTNVNFWNSESISRHLERLYQYGILNLWFFLAHPVLSSSLYSVSLKILHPWRFLEFFPERLRIFNSSFTCLLCVHIYAQIQKFCLIVFSPTSQSYAILSSEFLNFTRKMWKPRYLYIGMTDLHKIWKLGCLISARLLKILI